MKASNQFIANQVLRLINAFPGHSANFFDLLTERIEANSFTEQEVTTAIEHCIDNFEYKNLTIAAVLKQVLNERPEVYIIPD